MNRLGDRPHLCLITPGALTDTNYQTESAGLVETVRVAAMDGVNVIQLREKNLSGGNLLDLARRAVEAVAGTCALIFVNDRADVAVAAGAAGVHLPKASLPPAVVKEKFPTLLIGVSTHSLAASRTAFDRGADFILFGPVFETPGKGNPVGLDVLGNVCQELGRSPVIALGGINDTNFEQALSAGAAGIAAIRALNDRESRRSICERVRQEG